MLSDPLSLLALYGLFVALLLLGKVTGMMTRFDMGYLLSSRDESRSLTGMLGRTDRALANSVTALTLVAPAVLIGALRDTSGDAAPAAATVTAMQVFLIARLIYAPAYVLGISGLRTFAWLVGFAATVILYLAAL